MEMNSTDAGLSEIFRTRDFVGWEVVDAAGDRVGSVADLLIDASGRVRFVDVEYGFPRKHVLVPQERLDWGERRVVVDSWAREVARLPPYDPSRALDRGMVEELRRAFPATYDEQAHHWRAPVSEEPRVLPLSQARGFKLEKGAPDLKGWNVFGSDGERLGIVSQLMVDPGALRVRYLDVDLHSDLFRLRDDRHVLVPMERVDLRERGKDVWVSGLPAASLALLPAYTGGAVTPVLERAIEEAFERGEALPALAPETTPPLLGDGEGESEGAEAVEDDGEVFDEEAFFADLEREDPPLTEDPDDERPLGDRPA